MDVPAYTNPTWLIEASKTTTHSDSYTNNPIICYKSLEKTPLKSSNGMSTPDIIYVTKYLMVNRKTKSKNIH